MKYWSIFTTLIFAVTFVRAQGDNPISPAPAQPQPAVAAPEAPAAPVVKPEMSAPVEAPKAEPKAVPAPEPKAEPKPEAKAEANPVSAPAQVLELKAEPVVAPESVPAPEAKPKAKPVAAKPAKKVRAAAVALSPEELLARSFQALKAAAGDADSDLRAAALDDLRVFVDQHPDAADAPEALSLLARQEDYRPAMVDWLRLAYEYPDSPFAQKAKSEYLDIVNRKMRSKLQAGLTSLAKTPEDAEKSDRLAQMIYGLSDKSGDALYDPLLVEARRFEVRFPDYKDGDRILWSLAQLHMADGKLAAVVLVYRELLAREGSPFQDKAQFAMADLYAERLKKYKEAADAYQEFVKNYPDSERVLPALEKLAVVYGDRLEQYPLAVETYERIIKLFPKSDGALRAFNAEAKMQRDRLKQSDEAVKTYERLAGQFTYPPAGEALLAAADICRKDLQDYKHEVALRVKLAADFPAAKEAPEQLYQAAGVAEDDIKDEDGAIKIYRQLASQFAAHKLGKKGGARAAKLEQKRGGG